MRYLGVLLVVITTVLGISLCMSETASAQSYMYFHQHYEYRWEKREQFQQRETNYSQPVIQRSGCYRPRRKRTSCPAVRRRCPPKPCCVVVTPAPCVQGCPTIQSFNSAPIPSPMTQPSSMGGNQMAYQRPSGPTQSQGGVSLDMSAACARIGGDAFHDGTRPQCRSKTTGQPLRPDGTPGQ